MKYLIRLFAFFGKELNEVRRQPRLVLSLIFGPFLILLLFGLGYMNQPPPLKVSLVIPAALQGEPRVEAIRRLVEKNFNLVSTHPEPGPALDELARGRVELVEILPPDALQRLESGQKVPFQVIYSNLDPQKAQFYEYTTYLQVDAINTSLLLDTINRIQGDVANARQQIGEVRGQIQQINAAMAPEQIGKTRQLLTTLDSTLILLSSSPVAYAALAYQQDSQGQNGVQNLVDARQDIRDLDASLQSGELAQQQQQVQELDQRLGQMEERLSTLADTDPNAMVAPIEQQFQNLRGQTVDLMIYFAPAVLSLILQHIAVTLGALSLVRERMRGALEFFSVAPTGMLQVLVGKYLAYLIFLGLITAVLVGLLVFGLGVPFLGNLWAFTLLTLLFLFASVGVGFFISVISRTDNQAIQISMLALLLSIFFSGFILPLEYFRPQVGAISYGLPVYHAINGFRRIMLLGQLVQPLTVYALAAIGLLAFVLVALIWGRQFRRLA